MLVDPLANVLTSIRNAYMRGLDSTEILVNNYTLSVLQTLRDQKCLGDITSIQKKTPAKYVKVNILYTMSNVSIISKIQKVSKVSSQSYKDVMELKRLSSRNRDKIFIISTNKGLLTAQQAIAHNVGGEVLFFVSKIEHA